MRLQTCPRIKGIPRNSEGRRNSLLQEREYQVQCLTVSLEKRYMSIIKQTELVTFRNTYAHTYTYVCVTINLKTVQEFEHE